jgi:hypothetical protein
LFGEAEGVGEREAVGGGGIPADGVFEVGDGGEGVVEVDLEAAEAFADGGVVGEVL